MQKLKNIFIAFSILCATQLSATVITVKDSIHFDKLLKTHDNVVVKFFAPWCPACNAIAPAYKEYSEKNIYSHVTFLEVNYDDNEALIRKYKIRSIPAFLFFKKGQKANGLAQSEKDLVKKLNELFKK